MKDGIKKTIIKENILIIDPEKDIYQVVSSYLKDKYLLVQIDSIDSVQEINSYNPELVIFNTSKLNLKNEEILEKMRAIPNHQDLPFFIVIDEVKDVEFLDYSDFDIIDYLALPFNELEMMARVNALLKLKRFKNQIAVKNDELEKLNREKNELIAMTAHDMKNPIYNISMLAKVIRDEEDLQRDEIIEFTQDIVETSDRMLELITNLLDLNKIEQGEIQIEPEKININEIIHTVVDVYKDRASSKNIKLHFEEAETLSSSYVDRNSLVQVLDNLISNAVKYSPFDQNIYIKSALNDSRIRLSVKDEGPGISKEDQDRLFKKFQKLSAKPTADENSTGLGLSIVKRYVELIKGEVWCESDLGQGAEFIVEIPLITDM